MFRRVTTRVLLLLCAMYFITYVDRVNVSTAASQFGRELSLSHTQIGLVFSAFAYPYLVLNVLGGWLSDRFGPRRTLAICTVVWAGATILTGLATGFASLVFARLLLGLGEGATLPTAARAISHWVAVERRGFALGIAHAASRIGNAVAPPLITALMLATSWRGAFILTGVVSFVWAIVWLIAFRDNPRDHPGISADECAKLPPYPTDPLSHAVPWRPLCMRMAGATLVYFCYGWVLWLFLAWIPQYFYHDYHLRLADSALFAAGVFSAGVLGDWLGGEATDRLLRRTRNPRIARNVLVSVCMFLTLLSLLPILLMSNLSLVTAALCLSGGFFFNEMTIGPMWSVSIDIAPNHAGTASGIMNIGASLAAIVSPVVGGLLIDRTGNWNLPFVVSIAVVAAGVVLPMLMHPERPLGADDEASAPTASGTLAGEIEGGTQTTV
ncbi:MFS transporter [Burkholderia sp. WAC0059]|uniref:MFS transporter n=1 Tax=Burkholderia sp. WAC0059 TaxID=2066022 RepID=UPI000C7F2467|nr:MFS transporter [Burkholderia sp. WAC0059]PLZ00754.1 MFS transporter [Burkholderia sp. WAC0059]